MRPIYCEIRTIYCGICETKVKGLWTEHVQSAEHVLNLIDKKRMARVRAEYLSEYCRNVAEMA